ncbi:M14 family metallopeptidase [Ferrimonas senticii]|uniref:M14 family metallopeptidase n=1 Tax=Ferrimonas senticii TaxID=394566 RepID=UPI000423EFE3|nr:M14 family metallocarboxypeptidase [Ferrimonas senticii]
MNHYYSIGQPGQPWGESERQAWLAQCQIKRSYQQLVVPRIEALAERFELSQYGALSYDPQRYPLYAIKSRDWHSDKPKVLITGGVHGYETSGVMGALSFLEQQGERYAEQFDLLVLPCISPWGFETINRWNPNCVDPNRSFKVDSASEEAAAVVKLLAELNVSFLAHFDLHETTDSDKTEFRPALAARDGGEFHIEQEAIPDGFYNVDDSERATPAFQKAIIDAVRQVTHIAPADGNGQIIGADVVQEGVIEYPKRSLFLCGGLTDAPFVTTTEVYPDSPKATPEQCNAAQVAAVCGGLDYLLQR